MDRSAKPTMRERSILALSPHVRFWEVVAKSQPPLKSSILKSQIQPILAVENDAALPALWRGSWLG